MKILKDQPDLAVPPAIAFSGWLRADIRPRPADLSGGGNGDAGKTMQQGGLAGPRGAAYAEAAAGFEIKHRNFEKCLLLSGKAQYQIANVQSTAAHCLLNTASTIRTWLTNPVC